MMRKIVTAVLGILLGGIGALAQQPPPSPADTLETAWHVTLSGAYSNLSNAQTNNGYLTAVALRFSQHWSLRADYFTVAKPNAKIGTIGPEYNLSLAHILKPNQFINSTPIEFGFKAGVGAGHLEPCPNAQFPDQATCVAQFESIHPPQFKFAAAAGFNLNIRASSSLVLRPVEVNYVYAPGVAHGFFGNQLQFAAGLGLRF